MKQHYIPLPDSNALRFHGRLYIALGDGLASRKMLDVEMRCQINQHASCHQGGDLADIQLGESCDGRDVLTAMTVIKLTVFTDVAQTINLRACTEPHLHKVVI